ncbi:hypothetical protein [Rhodococcus sp. ACT016]|uniref:hypothetical protein n=1 Tax=Rhodococcus sp. ACT016 TaxID=3134808 RepID=UPI003D288F3B
MFGKILIVIGALAAVFGASTLRTFDRLHSPARRSIPAAPAERRAVRRGVALFLAGIATAGVGLVAAGELPPRNESPAVAPARATADKSLPVLGYTVSPAGTLVVHYRIASSSDYEERCQVAVRVSGIQDVLVTAALRDTPGGPGCDRDRYIDDVSGPNAPTFAEYDTGVALHSDKVITTAPIVDATGADVTPFGLTSRVPPL